MRNIASALLGDPAVEASKPLIGKDDIVVFSDGRGSANSDRWQQELRKRMHKNKEAWPSRGAGNLRHLYSNEEFDCGYAAPKRKFQPEPLETNLLFRGKGMNLEERQRRFIDLPGTNRSRGWAKLKLKSLEDRLATTTTKDLFEAMAAEDPHEKDDKKGSTETLQAPASDESAGEDEAPTASEGRVVHPWEPAEELMREMYHCFLPPNGCIVDLFASFTAAMAAVRDKRRYVGFCFSGVFMKYLMEALLLKVLLELILKNRDGFAPGIEAVSLSSAVGEAPLDGSALTAPEAAHQPEENQGFRSAAEAPVSNEGAWAQLEIAEDEAEDAEEAEGDFDNFV